MPMLFKSIIVTCHSFNLTSNKMKRTLLLLLISTSAFIARSQNPGLVLHQPAMDKVTVEEGKKFMAANDTTLVFDIYYPQGFDKKQQLPVVVFVNGVGSMELHRWKIYQDWGRLVAANGLIGVTYQTRRNHAADDSERMLDYLGAH